MKKWAGPGVRWTGAREILNYGREVPEKIEEKKGGRGREN